MTEPLVVSGQEWTFDLIDEVYAHIERIAIEKYDLDVYSNVIEIIDPEQMIDAYAANGLPIFYPHWSFGEQFVKQLQMYKRGRMGLAYEIVINSNPCISYLMGENTMAMQTLVMAHAAFGHNTFFKTNYLFRNWTEASSIIDYLSYSKKFIRDCEDEYGFKEVEMVLDCAHSIQTLGVDKYKRPSIPTAAEAEKKRDETDKYIQSQVNEIWKTIPKNAQITAEAEEKWPTQPQENLVRFIEENAPRLAPWQREILRIVRNISQYFYPQMQTKVCNEGTATFWHFTIMNDLYDEGIVSDDAMLEFLQSHSDVLYQPGFSSKYFNGINPYTLGYAVLRDVKRICLDPTEEDREWFNNDDWVGSGDWVSQIKYISAEFKDESLIKQFLSPTVMRDLRLFDVVDDDKDPALEVNAIHNPRGYQKVRNALSETYNIAYHIPDIQVTNVDRWGDRSMQLTHTMANNRPIDPLSANETLKNVGYLWGYNVSLKSINSEGEVQTQHDYIANNDGDSMLTISTM